MTKAQGSILILCAVCAAVTVGSHVFIKKWVVATLVALAVCVGGLTLWGWSQQAESALWIIGVIIADAIAAAVTVVVSAVCAGVRLGKAANRPGPRQPPESDSSVGDDRKRL